MCLFGVGGAGRRPHQAPILTNSTSEPISVVLFITLVSEIAGLLKTDDEKKKEYISFASKFCAFHNEAKFPIYDRISREMLSKINKEHHFTDKFNKDKIPYEKYVGIYNSFIEKFGLEEFL